ncbi:hypothetical protein [Yunchengibacter salinarum]|uniref:hypothetical protein n=1 Tax=Yunchengibacter salinarum TaxID=3133399 RepID=UPI0035B6847A
MRKLIIRPASLLSILGILALCLLVLRLLGIVLNVSQSAQAAASQAAGSASGQAANEAAAQESDAERRAREKQEREAAEAARKLAERKAEVTARVRQTLGRFEGAPLATLADHRGAILATLKVHDRYFDDDSPMAGRLLLLSARASATSKRDPAETAALWKRAIPRLFPELDRQERLALLMQAAIATDHVGASAAANGYFERARALARHIGGDEAGVEAELRVLAGRLMAEGGRMEWRALRDALRDMRKLVEGKPLWTPLSVTADLHEIAIRMRHQPESREKRLMLSRLQQEIIMALKVYHRRGETLPGDLETRRRQIFYELADRYDLKEPFQPVF